jgi:hypothetical protein
MLQEDFSETSEIQKITVDRKQNTSHSKFNLSKLQQLKITNKPYSIFKDTEFDENFAEIEMKKQSYGLPVSFTALLTLRVFSLTGKPMSQSKLIDIKSIMQLTPDGSKHSFRNLRFEHSR